MDPNEDIDYKETTLNNESGVHAGKEVPEVLIRPENPNSMATRDTVQYPLSDMKNSQGKFIEINGNKYHGSDYKKTMSAGPPLKLFTSAQRVDVADQENFNDVSHQQIVGDIHHSGMKNKPSQFL